VRSRENHKKHRNTIKVEKNSLKRKKHLFLFIQMVLFFEKKQVFVLLKKKTQKPHSELFVLHHAISPFQNYTIITCYTYYGIQI